MNTKQAREIRKGIEFANGLYESLYVTHDTALQHYWLSWQLLWLDKATKLSMKAYLHRIARLEIREYHRSISSMDVKRPAS